MIVRGPWEPDSEGRMFKNRHHAGQVLARQLTRYEQRNDVLVLALPRGGVPVGFELARALGVALDVFVVRKLGVPEQQELAMGAIASGGQIVLNEDVVTHLHIDQATIDAVAQVEMRELSRREKAYRGDRPPLNVAGKTLILVDDGLATGATMRAAAQALKQLGPARLIVAVPVGAPEVCRRLAHEVDEVVCAATPEPFRAVGQWYADFTQTTDEEVHGLLAQAQGAT